MSVALWLDIISYLGHCIASQLQVSLLSISRLPELTYPGWSFSNAVVIGFF